MLDVLIVLVTSLVCFGAIALHRKKVRKSIDCYIDMDAWHEKYDPKK